MMHIVLAVTAVFFTSQLCFGSNIIIPIRTQPSLPTIPAPATIKTNFGRPVAIDYFQVQIQETENVVNLYKKVASLRMVASLSNHFAEYETSGYKWSKSSLTWCLKNTPPSTTMTQAQIKADIAKAFAKWASVTCLTFIENCSGTADIEIGFYGGSHGDGAPFDTATLAHAFFPYSDSGIAGDVHFDSEELWTAGSTQGTNFYQVALHEIGHALGLDHSNDKSAIMYPSYSGYDPNAGLTSDDIAGIQSIYGKCTSISTTTGPTTTTPKSTSTTTGPTTTTPKSTSTTTGPTTTTSKSTSTTTGPTTTTPKSTSTTKSTTTTTAAQQSGWWYYQYPTWDYRYPTNRYPTNWYPNRYPTYVGYPIYDNHYPYGRK